MAGVRGVLIAGALVALGLPGVAAAKTIKVTTQADALESDGKCSLREAVTAANTNANTGGCTGGTATTDTIKLKAKDYELTIPPTAENQNQNGDLDVADAGPVKVIGAGRNETTISTALADRVLDLVNPGKLTLMDLTAAGGDVTSLSSGFARGGNVRAESGGTVILEGVGVNDGAAFTGGGLYATGDGKLKVKRSRFTGNDATGLGGALDAQLDGKATISTSTFEGNTASNPDGASIGGGISNRSTSMKITDTTISDNHALGTPSESAHSGGIVSESVLTVRRSLIADNTAATPTSPVFEAGGGIHIQAGPTDTATIVNSTFFRNAAGTPDGLGGAIYVTSGTVIVSHATFAGNAAGNEGDGLFSTLTGYMLFRNSVLDDGDPCGLNSGDPFDSADRNLARVNDPDCDFQAEDEVGLADLGLKSGLDDNGGPTKTIALKKSSPAVNLVPKANCSYAQGEDQRKYKRPGRGSRRCDAGAYERRAKPR